MSTLGDTDDGRTACFRKPLELHLTVTPFKWICSDCGQNNGSQGVGFPVNPEDRPRALSGCSFPWNPEGLAEESGFRKGTEKCLQ